MGLTLGSSHFPTPFLLSFPFPDARFVLSVVDDDDEGGGALGFRSTNRRRNDLSLLHIQAKGGFSLFSNRTMSLDALSFFSWFQSVDGRSGWRKGGGKGEEE